MCPDQPSSLEIMGHRNPLVMDPPGYVSHFTSNLCTTSGDTVLNDSAKRSVDYKTAADLQEVIKTSLARFDLFRLKIHEPLKGDTCAWSALRRTALDLPKYTLTALEALNTLSVAPEALQSNDSRWTRHLLEAVTVMVMIMTPTAKEKSLTHIVLGVMYHLEQLKFARADKLGPPTPAMRTLADELPEELDFTDIPSITPGFPATPCLPVYNRLLPPHFRSQDLFNAVCTFQDILPNVLSHKNRFVILSGSFARFLCLTADETKTTPLIPSTSKLRLSLGHETSRYAWALDSVYKTGRLNGLGEETHGIAGLMASLWQAAWELDVDLPLEEVAPVCVGTLLRSDPGLQLLRPRVTSLDEARLAESRETLGEMCQDYGYL
ncbi:hypothetical protein TREMEDRAFT_66390 [Tremella mesenterica DSM 1558]|uniref:uncharacterized protein n=1 Tax=Tremella mesenterica (strain ATCC 24925 / CBS 8224 / DSM 1558 / NBRC 9311 / NRRL Y-6157 / RJB 2259-6 / UBC 559-6) TaxID=578456 RepID=UPI00032BAD52|nr:uncharacterized protein TREMEDRAFT_66390 [Tremella mesenterica DSM 1558]EIW65662.1 hypothetical protein TREMEDRAFT_66390 [Tremella mesenterica DSM 1558]